LPRPPHGGAARPGRRPRLSGRPAAEGGAQARRAPERLTKPLGEMPLAWVALTAHDRP